MQRFQRILVAGLLGISFVFAVIALFTPEWLMTEQGVYPLTKYNGIRICCFTDAPYFVWITVVVMFLCVILQGIYLLFMTLTILFGTPFLLLDLIASVLLFIFYLFLVIFWPATAISDFDDYEATLIVDYDVGGYSDAYPGYSYYLLVVACVFTLLASVAAIVMFCIGRRMN